MLIMGFVLIVGKLQAIISKSLMLTGWKWHGSESTDVRAMKT